MTSSAQRLVSVESLLERAEDVGLVVPDHWSGPGWVLTDGPAVADLNAAAGFAPDPQQELGLDMIFAVGADGLPASFATAIISCRQNLKTGLLKQAATGWMFVTDERKVVWSAHEMSTTLAAQTELAELWLSCPALARRMLKQKNDGVYSDNGSERIELANGQTLLFKARTNGGGRGLTGDKVILDEAFALKASHVGSLIPTMTARPSGQVVYASSAGKDDSAVLRDVRDRGRAGTSPRLSYLEWGAPKRACADPDCQHPKSGAQGCALDDRELWLQANPTITTGRISLQTIADLRQELPPEEFARESLGWWDDAEDGVGATFGVGRWEACAIEPADLPGGMPEAPAAIGIAVSVDRTRAVIAAASVVEVLPVVDTGEGLEIDEEAEPEDKLFVASVDGRDEVGWLLAEAHRIQTTYDCSVLIREKGPAKDLADDLEDADVALDRVSHDEYAVACSRVFDKVRAQDLLHPSSPDLDTAVAHARWRTVGDRRVWDARCPDAEWVEAMTLAVHGAAKHGSGPNLY